MRTDLNPSRERVICISLLPVPDHHTLSGYIISVGFVVSVDHFSVCAVVGAVMWAVIIVVAVCCDTSSTEFGWLSVCTGARKKEVFQITFTFLKCS